MGQDPDHTGGEARGSGNLLAGIPGSLPEEFCEALAAAGGVRIERVVSRGHCSPEGFWYDQDRAEWVAVLQGRARLRREADAEDRTLGPGDYIFLPAHCRHRVTWTDPGQDTIWLAVHFDT